MSKNIIAAIVVVIVIGAAIGVLAFTSPGGPVGPGPGGGGEEEEEEVVSIAIEDAGDVDPKLIRMDIRNTGNVDIKIQWISVKDTDIEGGQIQTASIKAGDLKQGLDVGLTKGELKTGANPLTFTIETDKGDFELDYTITVE